MDETLMKLRILAKAETTLLKANARRAAMRAEPAGTGNGCCQRRCRGARHRGLDDGVLDPEKIAKPRVGPHGALRSSFRGASNPALFRGQSSGARR